jgi:hypothetical protein
MGDTRTQPLSGTRIFTLEQPQAGDPTVDKKICCGDILRPWDPRQLLSINAGSHILEGPCHMKASVRVPDLHNDPFHS